MDNRHDRRMPVAIHGYYRSGTGRVHDVQITNLSRSGCRMQQNHNWLDVGASIALKIDQIGPIDSVVRWKNSDEMGVEFADPLHPSVLDHLAAQFGTPG